MGCALFFGRDCTYKMYLFYNHLCATLDSGLDKCCKTSPCDNVYVSSEGSFLDLVYISQANASVCQRSYYLLQTDSIGRTYSFCTNNDENLYLLSIFDVSRSSKSRYEAELFRTSKYQEILESN